jgi:transaldolase/glucose-6-phosphate isomerase
MSLVASLLDLARHGQSAWPDFIDRSLMPRGGLQRRVDGGVTGATTNPSIFNKAIGAGRDYDEAIREPLEAEA